MKKGPIFYDEIEKVDRFHYKAFRDVCFEMLSFKDGRELMEAIKEAHVWCFGLFLKILFVTMLLLAQ